MKGRWVLAGALAAGLTLPVLAQQQRISRGCIEEAAALCPTSDRQERRACLREKRSELSADCRGELLQRMRGQRGAGAEQSNATETLSFGPDQRQGIDYYGPAARSDKKPPLILFVHGGGWRIGSREASVHTKPAHFTSQGYAFASVGYRLLPDAPVETQAADVAAGLAYMREEAGRLGYDPDQIILMGHSAGAHLAALVATDPQYAGEDMAAIRGVVLLDGAGYDVAANMAGARRQAAQMYDAAFSDDPERQRALSPITHVGTPDAANWLILHVAERAGSREQSEMLGAALAAAGASVSVEAVSGTDHGRMNRELGTQGDTSTGLVDAFLKGL